LQNNAAEAEAYEEKANAVWRELALRSGDPELLRDLSIEYGKRAMTLQQNKRHREALTEFLQALAIDERLAKEAPSTQSLRDLAITCGQLAELYDEMGNADEQKSYRARELELRELVADQDDLPELWDELAVTHYNYALLFSNSRESVRHFQRARDIWGSLARRCPENPTYKNRRDTASRALSDI
jgi:tetratricopeptide (TPR) repeat protein